MSGTEPFSSDTGSKNILSVLSGACHNTFQFMKLEGTGYSVKPPYSFLPRQRVVAGKTEYHANVGKKYKRTNEQ